jgi:hypothetical protein
MKKVYNILIIDDVIGHRYLNDQIEFKIKVALESLLKNKATVNISTFIGSSDDSSFLIDFVLNENKWGDFYSKNKKQFDEFDLIIIDTQFSKAPNNQGVWGDKLTSRLIELDSENEKKIIGVSEYKIEGKHFWGQSYSDRILMERICNILNIDANTINEEYGKDPDATEKNKGKEADAIQSNEPFYLSCKKIITGSRPFVFETLTFLITLLFIWVLGMVMWYTIGRVKNTFNDGDVNHHNTAEFKAYDAQIKDVIDLLSTTYLTNNDSLQGSTLILSLKDSALRADNKKKASELYTTLHELHKVHDSSSNTRVFELIENLFLLFIPLFVVLGFYVYFQKSLSKHLLGGDPGSEVDDNTKKSIEVTKKLFLTSIFSFTIIKILDIFINDISFLPYYTIPINIVLKVGILTIVLLIIIWYNYSSVKSS